ncbi:MAG: hypothetical protein HN726_04090 [Candidatus Magasanikbacteria bacterium]|jgi:hypothetical protein|nr:hypothetical protein [Candidatus Magasanikbacteria bacterium]MBT4220715.1 hypothetical protein [Candidatus Magasanikbacteria bacterium]MBT4350060.1 hypothetical protein [Candidatus Magasanikbacteria bacterium]MBT4541497.1 hypothetical protein [Candidatus Magasanikbacteria bacterium]MBT6253025.1 hypothetical protein [Candidatus Magasanikbacteria bacterium]
MFRSPIIFREGSYTYQDIISFFSSHRVWSTRDIYDDQLQEYFLITHPQYKHHDTFSALFSTYKTQVLNGRIEAMCGNWVYFPWSGRMVHMVSEGMHHALRTNRNHLLITQEEQKMLLNVSIAVAGLSIGSSIISTLVHNGIGRNLRLADHDIFETTNMNRVRSRIDQVGVSKVSIVTEQLFEINPYLVIDPFSQGVDASNLVDFVRPSSTYPLILFEAIDDFKMKVRLRLQAKKNGVPVVMLTNLGDGILIDIERYDIDPQTKMFNGLVGDVPERILSSSCTEEDMKQFAVSLVGKEHVPQRAFLSLEQMGKTLVGRPQLMGTVTASSGIAPYIVRRMLFGPSLASGRYYIHFDTVLS